MPVMDGLEATRRIHDLPGRESTPIIAMTANIFDEDRQSCEDAGMVAFLAKPIDPTLMFNTLARWLGDPTSLEAAQPGPTPDSTPAVIPVEVPLTDAPPLPGLDHAQGMRIWRDKPETYFKFLRKFMQDYAETAHTIAQALDQKDAAAARAMAHKLKGAAGNLALTDVAREAGAIDQLLKSGTVEPVSVAALQQALDTAMVSISAFVGETPSTETRQNTFHAVNVTLTLPVLHRLMQALNTDNPDDAEPVLRELGTLVSASDLEVVQTALDNFDFRGAEEATRKMCASLGLTLENEP